jgi:hypothetical protein
MNIIYKDGGILTCETIEVWGDVLIADDFRIVDLCDIERIERNDE